MNGKLQADLAFRGGSDDEGLVRYCYVSNTGQQSPTLRVQAGDEVVLNLKKRDDGIACGLRQKRTATRQAPAETP